MNLSTRTRLTTLGAKFKSDAAAIDNDRRSVNIERTNSRCFACSESRRRIRRSVGCRQAGRRLHAHSVSHDGRLGLNAASVPNLRIATEAILETCFRKNGTRFNVDSVAYCVEAFLFVLSFLFCSFSDFTFVQSFSPGLVVPNARTACHEGWHVPFPLLPNLLWGAGGGGPRRDTHHKLVPSRGELS